MSFYKSRKFWAAFTAALTAIGAAVSGEITWATAAQTVAGVAIAYIAGVAYEDGKQKGAQ
jgi:hypothetical protein